ncbi:ABC transporter substrate-binding protein [Caldalkalibacillus salinus]|uniref:ABC transporter substrate-binding protein n=1 Tax=Caldalkalibacillus salinus TaxID=2803787 RepID=UPI001921AE94|nr:ABC transporter substrate-binding protein [Caldalkalibacillus salinus]
MKLTKSMLLLLVLILSLGTALVACSNETSETSDEQEGTGEKVDGGSVTFSMFSAPNGVFNPVLYEDAYEANVFEFIFEGLVKLDKNLGFEPNLARDWYYEDDHQTLVMVLREDVQWHDGEPFTAEDVKYTYDVMAHPDYTGVRSYFVEGMVGYEAFNSGEVDEFEGVEIVDDHHIKFHFNEPNVMALRDASFDIIPKHIYGQYDVADLATAPETLDFDKLIGTGPFKATSDYTAGQYYTLERHEQYWQGAPNLDSVVWTVVNQDVAAGMLDSGDIDVITTPQGVRASDYDQVAGIDGVTVHETPDLGYQHLGFKLHHRTEEDVENNVHDPDNWIPNEKLQSLELRQAIMYAIDRQGIVEGLLDGHGEVINAPFPPASWAYDDTVVNEYPHDQERAQELLASAGYEDVTGDGYLEDPNGEELVLRLDYPTGDRVREMSAPIIQEHLEAVGLNIDLRSPREAGSHFEAIRTDEEGMDLYLSGWGLATTDPDPKGIWDITASYNYTRWNDEHSQQLLDDAVTAPEAFDEEYRKEKYREWAAYVNEQVPMAFLYTSNAIFAYNSNIEGVVEGPDHIYRDIHKWYLVE